MQLSSNMFEVLVLGKADGFVEIDHKMSYYISVATTKSTMKYLRGANQRLEGKIY